MLWKLTLLLCLMVVSHASASPPFEMPHPENGDAGVWIPVYIQRYHLQVEHELEVCWTDQRLVLQQRAEALAALEAEKTRSEELGEAYDVVQLALGQEDRHVAGLEVKLQRRTRWALTTTITTAILVSLFGAYTAAKR